VRNNYVENKSALLSGINIVPLIGVIAVLLVVMMMAFPGFSQAYTLYNQIGIYCGPIDHSHTHQLKIRMDGSGNASINNIALSNRQITKTIAALLPAHSHRITAEVDIDQEASYQDAVLLFAALQNAGLEENNILVIDNRLQ